MGSAWVTRPPRGRPQPRARASPPRCAFTCARASSASAIGARSSSRTTRPAAGRSGRTSLST
eukprot:15169046-Alexandrium_andersonii.AAC.1